MRHSFASAGPTRGTAPLLATRDRCEIWASWTSPLRSATRAAFSSSPVPMISESKCFGWQAAQGQEIRRSTPWHESDHPGSALGRRGARGLRIRTTAQWACASCVSGTRRGTAVYVATDGRGCSTAIRHGDKNGTYDPLRLPGRALALPARESAPRRPAVRRPCGCSARAATRSGEKLIPRGGAGTLAMKGLPRRSGRHWRVELPAMKAGADDSR